MRRRAGDGARARIGEALFGREAGAQARSLPEGRYNEKLPVAGSVIKLFS